MKGENRGSNRVRFDHKHPVNLMGVDGTWRRSCVLLDVSATGAKIEVEGTVDVLQAKEFFLLLSSTGLAFRRCELVWIDGCNAGIRFVQLKPGQKRPEISEKKAETTGKTAEGSGKKP
ncbi:MAG TPA: PilZ domain-containing protein [Bradyrhizobium sp.]|nr:PilZ domain-containing protein [Bradyrhizobium sp.]